MLLACLLMITWNASAQLLTGTVTEKSAQGEQPLAGVNIHWAGTFTGTVTDGSGRFSLQADSLPALLVFSMVGYQPDTIKVMNTTPVHMVLRSSVNLKEITVERKRNTTITSTINPINTQIIGSGELKKAACCNLAESFETNPSVDVNYTDAVSGARQIQMLGLDGIYTQILSENLPLVHGLNASYGLSYVPGPFVESIYVTKGTGSVVNGFESITGQINVEVVEPHKADKFFVNGYMNSDLRTELNASYSNQINKRLSSILFLHGSDAGLKRDDNHDSFLDGPLGQQVNVLNRWHYQGDQVEGQLGLRAVWENRQGGQVDFDPEKDKFTTNHYGIGIYNRQFEIYTKTGLLFPKKEALSIALITSTRLNHQDMYFGFKTYDADQTGFYSNLIYQNRLFSEFHLIKAGLSFVYDDYKESYMDSVMNHHETVPGAYAEYNYNDNKKLAFIIGGRADYHNTYGWFFTPRVHFKYHFRPETVLRLSGGSGFRTAQVFTENASVFANSRTVVLAKDLQPEKAWNTGVSFTHQFHVGEKEGSFIADYFYTSFVNQVVLDMEHVHEIRFYNLSGPSYSHSIQGEINFSPVKRLDLRVAYKHYDVRTTYGSSLLDRPFVPKDRVLVNAAYATNLEKWKFDVTYKWLGISRIPNTAENPEAYRLPENSEKYSIINMQVTKAFRRFDLYAGVENLTDYTQTNPIMAADDPFGHHFDASMVWAPTIGRTFYAGFRLTLN